MSANSVNSVSKSWNGKIALKWKLIRKAVRLASHASSSNALSTLAIPSYTTALKTKNHFTKHAQTTQYTSMPQPQHFNGSIHPDVEIFKSNALILNGNWNSFVEPIQITLNVDKERKTSATKEIESNPRSEHLSEQQKELPKKSIPRLSSLLN